MGVIRSQTGCSNSTEKGMSPEPQNHIGKTSERLGVSLTIGGDLAVARIGFGAMRLCGPGIWGGPRDPASARMVLRRAIELGVSLIDTADAYGPEVNEQLIAETLHPYPEELVIATKGGLTRPRPGAWENDGRPEYLRAACEGSLRRLKLERIDLYQLHAPDPRVPLEESVGVLVDLRAEGKIRHIGISNVSVDELRRARQLVPIATVQNRYNYGDRSSEEILRECERESITGTLARVAARHNASPAQIAIAWLLARSPITVPIPGTSSIAHLEENVAALYIRLSPQDLAETK